jgi:ATP-dependent DNA helicase RecG
MNLSDLLNLIKAGESEHLEFKKSPGKDIQKVIIALANAEGGHILLGVDDDGTIVGTDIKKAMNTITTSLQSVIPSPKISTNKLVIEKKEVLVIKVEKSNVLCSVGGIAYIRIGAGIRPLSIQEVLVLSSELGTVDWDSAPIVSIKQAKKDYIKWFFNRMEETRGRKVDKKQWTRYLRSIGALKEDKLTNAGVLFFTNGTEIIPWAKLRFIYMEENEPVASKEYTGPVWKIIEDVYTDVLRETGKTEVIISARRKKLEQYPFRAIREAIINAIAHRNYLIQADIRVFLHSNRIVIRNPGGLLPGVDLNDPEHIPRNPALCNLLFDIGFIERYGYGINMIRAEVKKHPWLKLDFDCRPHRFEITLSKDFETLLDPVDLRILKILTEPKKSGEISEAIGLSKPSVLLHVRKMMRFGFVKKIGKGPQTKYVAK